MIKLHFEKKNFSKKQECNALKSNLEGTALNCVMAQRINERGRACKIFAMMQLKRSAKGMISPLTGFWMTSSC